MKKVRNPANVAQFTFLGLGTPAQLSLAPNATDWKKHVVPKTEKPEEAKPDARHL